MTWLLWLGLIPCLLVVAAVGISAYGSKRWADATLTLTQELDAARIGAGRSIHPPSTRYDSRELEGLPPPVQRYFHVVLMEDQPIIAAATVKLAGTFDMSATEEQWKAFTSRQRVVTRRPGFLWDAQVSMLPGLPVRVVDSYIAGKGRLHRSSSLGVAVFT